MNYFILFFVEIIILFFLSKAMSKTLSRFMSIGLLSFLFLPGIIIHELSHFLVASILLVPVGGMEFVPRKEGNRVKLGSVEIAKTDPIRRSLIGLAPVLLGLVIILGVVFLFSSNIPLLSNISIYFYAALVLGLTYFLFAVSNTMFSSSRDMEGAGEILLALAILFGAAYLLGFRPSLAILSKIITKEFIEAIQKSTLFLLVPIAIDTSILGVIRLFAHSQSRT